MVTFWSQKGGSYSLIFDQPESDIRAFLTRRLPTNVMLLTGAAFAKLEQNDARNERDRQAELLAAIRNRRQRNRLPWQKRAVGTRTDHQN